MANTADSPSLTEANRLAVLRSLALLDTPPSEAFDRVTRLAAKIIDAPMAMVSLVDETRQWFKSRFGIDFYETQRDISICTHVVEERRPLLIPDATLDPRFALSPLVTESPFIRAYAGIPLFTRDGYAVGTLCAMDQRPRQFGQDDIDTLTDLAQILEDAIQARELAAHTQQVLQFANERERLFRDTFEMAAAGVAHVALSGKLMRVNQCVCDLLGYTAAELERLSVIDLTHPEDIVRAAEQFRASSTGGVDHYHIDKRLQRKDRSYLWCHLSVAAKRSVYGKPEYMIAVIEDIGDQHQTADDLAATRDALLKEVADQAQKLHEGGDALRSHLKNLLISEQAVRHMEQRMRAIANNVPAMIGYWNRNLECEFANEAYREGFGLAPENIIGMRMQDLLGDKMFESVLPHVELTLQGQAQRFDRRHLKFDGSESFIDVRYVPDFDESAEVRGFFVLATDQTATRNVQMALHAANAKLTNDSITDCITGLSNRQVFHERGEDAAKQFAKRREVYGLILLDLDNFRQINEACGHDVCDNLLRAAAGMLKTQLRSHRDVAARLGSEEFAILCFGALDEELLLHIAETIRSEFGRYPLPAELAPMQLTASFGLAISRDPSADWKTCYFTAETALREAKRLGKNRMIFGRSHENTALHSVR
jgi:diguanylate cyclase (GGDEF)-like protein/PAS domain S-box-containing protein